MAGRPVPALRGCPHVRRLVDRPAPASGSAAPAPGDHPLRASVESAHSRPVTRCGEGWSRVPGKVLQGQDRPLNRDQRGCPEAEVGLPGLSQLVGRPRALQPPEPPALLPPGPGRRGHQPQPGPHGGGHGTQWPASIRAIAVTVGERGVGRGRAPGSATPTPHPRGGHQGQGW